MLCISVGNRGKKRETLENSVALSGLYRGCPDLSRISENFFVKPGSPCDGQSYE